MRGMRKKRNRARQRAKIFSIICQNCGVLVEHRQRRKSTARFCSSYCATQKTCPKADVSNDEIAETKRLVREIHLKEKLNYDNDEVPDYFPFVQRIPLSLDVAARHDIRYHGEGYRG